MRWLGPESNLTSQVMVYDVADGSLTVAATAKAPTALDHPRWSPDGKRFAVEVGHLNADATDYDGAAIGLIDIASGDLEVLTEFDQFGAFPNWRADGKALVFDTYGFSYFRDTPAGKASDLWSIKVDGSGLVQLTHNPPGGKRSTQPFWRADGTIAYIAAGPSWGQGLLLRYLAADGDELADPAIQIRASYPRFRPGS